MKKVFSLLKFKPKVKLICWDLDGTLFDTETMWFNMDNLVKEKYGENLDKDEYSKASEEIAFSSYKTSGYRANADKALNFLKKNKFHQVLVNSCALTNKTVLNNEIVNATFSLNSFDDIVSEESFKGSFSVSDMYKLALSTCKTAEGVAIAICDMPHELEAAKNSGFITIWAKNKEYPFNEEELEKIEEFSDYYVKDFLDLIER